jgi:NAD(P)-dependent dehydrogenase (short-subunit alcohol dehydrogenase family)
MQTEPQTREAADFNGRRILVTGGAKGIGEAIVERFIRGGGKVITTARSLPLGAPDGSSKQTSVRAKGAMAGQFRRFERGGEMDSCRRLHSPHGYCLFG